MKSGKAGIDYKDVSVVAQGAISRSPDGVLENGDTYRCLKSIRKTLPGATIVLATWKGSKIDGLDYDVLVETEDPGPVAWGNLTKEGRPIVGSTNGLRQIIGSSEGLKVCKTKYALRVRNDMVLESDAFLDYFVKYSGLPCDENYKVLKKRIVTMTTCNPNRRTKLPFTIGDWFFFGLTEDVDNVFDTHWVKKEFSIPGEDGKDIKVDSLLSAEQNLWFGFISKYRQIRFEYTTDISNDNIALSEKYFANNCILLSAKRAGTYCLKYPGSAYGQVPCLSNTGLYTFTEYKRLLNKYANNHLTIIPNPIEEATYYTTYNLRFLLSKKAPKLWDFIRSALNPKGYRKEILDRAKENATRAQKNP